MRNAKKIIITLLALLLTLVSALTICYVVDINQLKHKQPHNEIHVQASNFTSKNVDELGIIKESVYNNNSRFSIFTLDEFLNFRVSTYMYDFHTKTVELWCDIDLSNVAWTPCDTFCGRFDGGGYTIKGAGKTRTSSTVRSGTLFGDLSGTKWEEFAGGLEGIRVTKYPGVENLRLEDFYVDTYNGSSTGFLAISVDGDVQISNISVEKCRVNKNGFTETIGGLVGYCYARDTKPNVFISDCEIIDVSITGDLRGDFGGIAGNVSSNFDDTVLTIERCVVKNFSVFSYSNINVFEDNYINAYSVTKSGTLIRKSHSEAKFLTIKNCCDNDDPNKEYHIDDFEEWGNVMSEMGVGGTWFFDSSFNDELPKLMNWLGKEARYRFYPRKSQQEDYNGYVYDDSGLFGSSLSLYQPDPTDTTYVSDVLDINDGKPDLKRDWITIGDKKLIATPLEGYKLSNWKHEEIMKNGITTHQYTAVFEPEIYTLTFDKAIGVASGETISPEGTDGYIVNTDGSISYNVYHGTTISASHTTGDGPLTLTYTFKNVKNEETQEEQDCTVTYKIPAKYKLTSVGDTSRIESDGRIIQPTVAIKKFDVNFDWEEGIELVSSSASSVASAGDFDYSVAATSQSVEYGTSVSWTITTTQAVFTFSDGTTKTFKAKDNYEIEYVTINGTEYKLETTGSEITGSTTITAEFNVYIKPIALFQVTFKDALDEKNATDKATLSASTNPITMRSGSRLTATYSGYKIGGTSTITYKYNGTTVATYTLQRYYIMEDNCKEAWNLTDIRANDTVTPIIKFYACIVTMKNESIDDKDENRAMATMSVTGDSYGTANDGIFVVEYNSSVNVTTNGNKYIYTFSNGGPVVTYTTTAEKYVIDDYGLVSTDKSAKKYTFDDNTETPETDKTISPKFDVKKYSLKVYKNGSEVLSQTIYHSSKLIYNADLSLTESSKFDFIYDCLYNPISKTEYKDSEYFLEYYKVTEVGKTPVENYTDGATVTDQITVESDITIELGFVRFYTVTFEENKLGVKSFENKNSYTNPINLRSGSKIEGLYLGYPNRELNYTVTYNNGKADITQDIAKYTIEQYYRVTDTQNVDNLNENTTISPTIEFYACIVTMGGIDSNIGARSVTGDDYNTSNDGIFAVEFGTIVTFKLDAGTEGLFKYTYTFKYGETTVATIVYTITNDDYAMQYVLDAAGERVGIYNGLDGELNTENWSSNTDSYEFPGPDENKSPTSEMTSKTILPTFGKKQYAGDLA